MGRGDGARSVALDPDGQQRASEARLRRLCPRRFDPREGLVGGSLILDGERRITERDLRAHGLKAEQIGVRY